jgi:hypothetical protein
MDCGGPKTLRKLKKLHISLKKPPFRHAILEKASISLKKSSNRIEIFKKAPHF